MLRKKLANIDPKCIGHLTQGMNTWDGATSFEIGNCFDALARQFGEAGLRLAVLHPDFLNSLASRGPIAFAMRLHCARDG
jgi:phage tail tape-measure protein